MISSLSIQDISTNSNYTLDHVVCHLLVLADKDDKFPQGNGRIYMDSDGSLRFVAKEKNYHFEIEDDSIANYVKDAFYRQYVNLANVIEMQEKSAQYFSLHIVFFPEEKNFLQLNIILSNKVRKTLKNKNFNNLAELQRRLILRDGITENLYFVYSSTTQDMNDDIETLEKAWHDVKKQRDEKRSNGTETQEDDVEAQNVNIDSDDTAAKVEDDVENNLVASDDSTHNQTDTEKEAEIPHKDDQESPYGKLQSKIRLYGSNYVIQAGIYVAQALDNIGLDEILVVAEKIIFEKVNVPCQRLGVAEKVSIVEERQHSANTVKRIFDNSDTYVSLWGKYAELEGQFLIQKMQMLSKLQFSQDINFDSDGTIPVIATSNADVLKYLKRGDLLSCKEEVPVYVSNPNIKWKDYKNELSEIRRQKQREKIENETDDDTSVTKNFKMVYSVEKIDISQNKVWLKPKYEFEIPKKLGKLYWDEFGYRMQIDRRERARENIRQGISANPRLGIIIGVGDDAVKNIDRIVKPVYQEHINPISASMESDLKHGLTKIQKKAIEIALNTPDIAIIQGPPGTGKTTVITSILKRLNEVLGKNGSNTGEVLVTSLQHDAVENVRRRVHINSLPIVKFGKSHRDKDSSEQDREISNWCKELAEAIRQKNPQLKETAEQKELANAYEIYAADSSNENARRFLKTASALSITVSPYLREQISSLQEKYKPVNEEHDNSALLASIRRLWTTPRAFRDGGSYHAALLLEELKEILPVESSDCDTNFIFNTLKKAAAWNREHPDEDIDEEFREDLRNCRKLLLQRSVARPCYQLEEIDEDIIALYQQIKQETIHPESEVDNILYGLLNNLEYNQYSIKNALKNYMFAYAATAQQSDSNDIDRAKNIDRRQREFPQYDTVIVDEAARVNPGDLMIPLSQAKRRIILVGDHRQLPHMYDQEIFDKMVEDGEKIDIEQIKNSMFEYLIATADKLYNQDNVERFITLDAQYRMHPLLGNFVSNNFYACHDPREAFSSPLTEDHFYQPFYPEPILWIDAGMKSNEDAERRSGASWVRYKEGDIIIQRIRQMQSQMPTGKPLSIGVISFYRGQVDDIMKRIQKDELLAGRVHVGTVDAYQGMEFDIIFLSIVRAQLNKKEIDWEAVENKVTDNMSEIERKKMQEKHDKIGRMYYGFLTSENRLCVALSRQKKLLIVVGNKDLFSGDTGSRLSAVYVPALKNFYELCESRGAVEHE